MLSRQLTGAEMRSLEPWQAEEFATYTTAHREELVEFLPWAETVVDVGSARAFLQRYADGLARDERRIYGLYDEHGRMLGGTLFRVFDTAASMCEVGVWLSAEARGRGLVTEAARVMVDWAIDVRGIHRVEWHCSTTNTASAAVARRLGMRLEGVHRESFRHRGRADDVEVWALLATERRVS
jgi:RimJ/RimL family protein N-acetyltransferase